MSTGDPYYEGSTIGGYVPTTTTGTIPSQAGYSSAINDSAYWQQLQEAIHKMERDKQLDPLRAAVAHARELNALMECFRDELKAMMREVLAERSAK